MRARLVSEDMGGVSAPMATPANVPGMGNPMPAQPGGTGSGDLWTTDQKPYTQASSPKKNKKKRKIRRKKKIVKESL